MSKHFFTLTPYFASNAFQESKERSIEKCIENRFKSILYVITHIWSKSSSNTPAQKGGHPADVNDMLKHQGNLE